MKTSVSLLVASACALGVVHPAASHSTPARGAIAHAAASVGVFLADLPAPMQVSVSSTCDPVTQPVAGSAPLRVVPVPTRLRVETVVVVPPENWWRLPARGTTVSPPEPCVPVASWSDTVLSV